ncbi:MAG: toprim domain-containing protein [Pigeon pea little leaf phytoplasma]|nr:toprim domain-containing protein [Pigeon pea little leaf phytoplasma]MDV3189141.1 toprim domain-containing protein [Pigeon pea little leaf phytoplasma]
MVDQTQIQYIKTYFPMLVLLKKLKILPVNFNRKYRFPCPIHQGHNPTCCHINENNNLHCWKCGKDYDIIDVYMAIRGLNNFSLACERITRFMQTKEFKNLIQQEQTLLGKPTTHTCPFKYQTPQTEPLDETKIKVLKAQLFREISPLFNQIRDYYHYLLINNDNVGLVYLNKKRGLKLSTIKEFNLGYAPTTAKPLSFQLVNYAQKQKMDLHKLGEYGLLKERMNQEGKKYYHDTFQGSIIIPIENGYGKTFHFYQNHFQASNYFRPKYQALPNFSQTPTFNLSYRFFEALPYIKQTQNLIIHEGFFDVISCWQHGIKNVVGLICVAQLLSQAQIAILKKEQIKVIIALDNDETGRKRSEVLGKQLQEANIRYEIRHILAPYAETCKDADDLLRQYGYLAYQKCFLAPYQKTDHRPLVDLAIHFFGKDKVKVIN